MDTLTRELHPDAAALDDLARFAALEVASADLEPWAALLRHLYAYDMVTLEEALWLVKLYNAFDDLASAWQCFRRWPSPSAWAMAADRGEIGRYPATQERRNLRGGRNMARHMDSYTAHLGFRPQSAWLAQGIDPDGDPWRSYDRLTVHLRGVWGTGRLAAFEWAEFCAKVASMPILCGDAQLWESSGPRASLCRLYGNEHPDPEWLRRAAAACRAHLHERGVSLMLEDFETVICDFNVMRSGRYYPGRHLAALAAEIATVADVDPAGAELLGRAWSAVVPAPWRDIAPGIDKTKLAIYAHTGRIVDAP